MSSTRRSCESWCWTDGRCTRPCRVKRPWRWRSRASSAAFVARTSSTSAPAEPDARGVQCLGSIRGSQADQMIGDVWHDALAALARFDALEVLVVVGTRDERRNYDGLRGVPAVPGASVPTLSADSWRDAFDIAQQFTSIRSLILDDCFNLTWSSWRVLESSRVSSITASMGSDVSLTMLGSLHKLSHLALRIGPSFKIAGANLHFLARLTRLELDMRLAGATFDQWSELAALPASLLHLSLLVEGPLWLDPPSGRIDVALKALAMRCPSLAAIRLVEIMDGPGDALGAQRRAELAQILEGVSLAVSLCVAHARNLADLAATSERGVVSRSSMSRTLSGLKWGSTCYLRSA